MTDSSRVIVSVLLFLLLSIAYADFEFFFAAIVRTLRTAEESKQPKVFFFVSYRSEVNANLVYQMYWCDATAYMSMTWQRGWFGWLNFSIFNQENANNSVSACFFPDAMPCFYSSCLSFFSNYILAACIIAMSCPWTQEHAYIYCTLA